MFSIGKAALFDIVALEAVVVQLFLYALLLLMIKRLKYRWRRISIQGG